MLTDLMPHDSTLQTLILTGEGHHELIRLRVVGVSDVKSYKLNSHQKWLGLSEQNSPKDKWTLIGWVKVQSYPRPPASAL
jgi:hypothetical protein